MPINSRLIAVLAAVLALGVNGQRSGGRGGGGGKGSRGGDAEPGCCYGSGTCVDTTTQTKCARMSRKGCEWRSGEDADCTEASSSEDAPEGYTIVCESRDCQKETIDCPETGPCTVVCEENACKDTTVNCPASYDCDISCVSDKGGWNCYEAIFNWAETPGLGSLECSGSYTCIDVDFPEPEPTVPMDIVCTDFRECEGATIRCPAEADCALTCVDGSSCRYTKLICPENHECNVKCQKKDTYGACDAMKVQWSSTPGLGSLTCIESGACDGVNSPPTGTNEQMSFGAMSLPAVAQPSVLLNGSLLLVAGACAVLVTLAAVFCVYNRESKTVPASWDNEE